MKCVQKNIYISSPKTNGLNPPKIGCFADVSPFLPRRVHFQGACVLLFPVVFLTNIRFLKSLKRGKKSGSWCFKPESCSCSYCRWVVGSALVVPVVGPSNTKYRSPMTADHWWELRLQRWQLRQKRNGGKMVCRFFFLGLPSKRDGDVGLYGLEGGPVDFFFGSCCHSFWRDVFFFSCGFILWRFLGIKHNISTFWTEEWERLSNRSRPVMSFFEMVLMVWILDIQYQVNWNGL